MIYGDGAFKDPVGKIWELADPVVSPAYTEGLEGSPNEIKLKYLSDNKFSNLKINDKLNDYIYNESLEGDYKNKVVININCKENISDLEKQDMIDIIRRNFGIQVKDLLYTYEKEQDKKAILLSCWYSFNNFVLYRFC